MLIVLIAEPAKEFSQAVGIRIGRRDRPVPSFYHPI
jgi:hypothetical protein